MTETGSQADARRLRVLQPVAEGPIVVDPHLAPWVRRCLLEDLARMRRSVVEHAPVLRLIDALSRASNAVADNGKYQLVTTKIESGDAPRLGPASTLSTKQAATAMGIPVRTVTWLLKTGRLEGWKLGREWVLPASSIDSWLEGEGR